MAFRTLMLAQYRRHRWGDLFDSPSYVVTVEIPEVDDLGARRQVTAGNQLLVVSTH